MALFQNESDQTGTSCSCCTKVVATAITTASVNSTNPLRAAPIAKDREVQSRTVGA
jgi:hypothetical protein